MRETFTEEQKRKILEVLKNAPVRRDLHQDEIAERAKMSRHTVSKYLLALNAEGKIKVTRRLGKIVFYEIKEKRMTS